MLRSDRAVPGEAPTAEETNLSVATARGDGATAMPRGETTRRLILDAAEQLFARYGINGNGANETGPNAAMAESLPSLTPEPSAIVNAPSQSLAH